MIDDSKITEAVDAYIGYPKEIDEGIETSMRRDVFKAGAEWFTKAIWHTPQESPEDDELIITEFGMLGNATNLIIQHVLKIGKVIAITIKLQNGAISKIYYHHLTTQQGLMRLRKAQTAMTVILSRSCQRYKVLSN